MKDSEKKSFSKQIKRYAQVGGVVGKLATKLASQKYLGLKLDKNKHAAEIRATLGFVGLDFLAIKSGFSFTSKISL